MGRRVGLFALAALIAAAPGAALGQDEAGATTPDQLQRVYACAAIVGDAERLACYDAAVPQLQTAQAGGQVVALDRGNLERMQEQSFGFNLPDLQNLLPRFGAGEAAAVESVQATVDRIELHASGRSSFYMSNGQVWTQVEAERVRNVRTGDTVEIARASLGSFMMISPRGGMGIRVRRSQ
jgi:hypothetical protein